MTPYRIKKHRKRGHHGSHMALVPFIDMLTMLVVFLLLHSSDVEILPNTKNITIPQSIAELKPRETVVVMVTTEDLVADDLLDEIHRTREDIRRQQATITTMRTTITGIPGSSSAGSCRRTTRTSAPFI